MKKIRLYCLPYAGGSSYAYSNWEKHLHPSIELVLIELPGRGRRINEALIPEPEEMVNDIFEKISDGLDDLPYVIFGHSMGGLLALELAHKILEAHKTLPITIIFSGLETPNLRSRKIISTLSDTEFIEEVINLGGTPRDIFAHKEVANIFLPILRNDFKLVESYQTKDYKPLDINISIFYGSQDKSTNLVTLQEWRNYTTKSCQWNEFEGGHFFINEDHKRVIDTINRLIVKATEITL